MVPGQQLRASLQRQWGPFLTHAFCQRCPSFLLFGPTDAHHSALLIWWAEVMFTQGRQGGFDVHGLMEPTITALTKTQLQYWQNTSWDWQSPLKDTGSPIPLSPATATPQTLPPDKTAHAGVLHQPTRSCGQAAGCLHFAGKQRQER